MKIPALLVAAALMGCAVAQTPVRDMKDLKIPFEHYTCKDRFGRTIDFYLSPSKSKAVLPLAVMIMGSGGQSMWIPHGQQIYGSLQGLLAGESRGRVRVLAVEKPGVPFCFQGCTPGTAEGATKEFLQEHTLERYSEAVDAAIHAARKLPGIDPRRTLVIGHSEGGIVAAKVAAIDPKVTDVAVLAGGGPSQLFDFIQMFGRDQTLETWSEIRKDPTSTTKFAWGHPYRRWSSFFADSPVAEALKSRARFYIAQGTADKNSLPASADVLYCTLLGSGRDVKMEVVEKGDHGFETDEGGGPPAGFRKILDHVLDWFGQGKP